MSPFDLVVYAVALVAVVVGFRSGLLRSLATIVGYAAAAALAVALSPQVAPFLAGVLHIPPAQSWIAPVVLFLAFGMLLSAMLRVAVSTFTGTNVSFPDRLGGALFGALRIGLVAVLIVLIFDRLIPADRQPDFLRDSRLRPYLSQAAAKGLRSLPPEVEAQIAKLKRERGL
ncbi:MAG: CvpA family protein [Pseudolabrys sp.]|jgi:membrane protein required for colicin V production